MNRLSIHVCHSKYAKLLCLRNIIHVPETFALCRSIFIISKIISGSLSSKCIDWEIIVILIPFWLFEPRTIVVNGPGVCIPVVLGGLLHSLLYSRCEIIFVESICRVYKLSLSGKILKYFADRFYVQWPQILKRNNQSNMVCLSKFASTRNKYRLKPKVTGPERNFHPRCVEASPIVHPPDAIFVFRKNSNPNYSNFGSFSLCRFCIKFESHMRKIAIFFL